ncbi:hypothetical protein [Azospirillum sp. A23]|uniref:hypothetical protein n=1 Tax=Azospirillum sp. A23 TaxID=3160608 RepID=UPI0036F31894
MAHFFREPDRRQRFLLPVDMMDWLPKDDNDQRLAVSVLKIVHYPSTVQLIAALAAKFL